MSNRFFFGLSIFIALLLHVAVFIYLPENTPALSPGAREKGIGGLKIGFIGSSAGNGLPIANPISTPISTNVQQEITPNPVNPINEISLPKVISTESASPAIIHSSIAKKSPPVKAKPIVQTKKKKTTKPVKKQPKNQKNPETTLDSSLNQDLANTTSAKKNALKGTGQGRGKQGSSVSGKGNSNEGGGKKGSIQSYNDIILAWLEKHKRYPRMARRRNQQGTAILYFKINRKGRVLNHKIRNSSGHSALDKEVTAMLYRASPLPPAPYNITGKTMEFTLPVAFNINH